MHYIHSWSKNSISVFWNEIVLHTVECDVNENNVLLLANFKLSQQLGIYHSFWTLRNYIHYANFRKICNPLHNSEKKGPFRASEAKCKFIIKKEIMIREGVKMLLRLYDTKHFPYSSLCSKLYSSVSCHYMKYSFSLSFCLDSCPTFTHSFLIPPWPFTM